MRAWTLRLAALGLVMLVGEHVQAKPQAPARFCEHYSGEAACAGEALACTYCHINQSPEDTTWNVYGQHVKDDLDGADFDAGIFDALTNVEDLDSDQDGFTNLDEIEAGTLPGDPDDSPGSLECPENPQELDYAICEYDTDYTYRKVMLDFCGHSPTFRQMEDFRAMGSVAQMTALEAALDECMDTEFWRGRFGVLWQLAYPKVRPVQALKAGRDASEIEAIRIADYYNDISLYASKQVDSADARDVLLTKNYVLQDGTEFTEVDEIGNSTGTYCSQDSDCAPNEQCLAYACTCEGACQESVDQEFRQGMLTTRWVALYNTMFTPVPRNTAAQAYRAFLDLDIAKQQGLEPVAGEPYDWDAMGVAAEQCAVCHSTLDPLTYPFTVYQGFGQNRAAYFPDRMQTFAGQAPEIENTPENGVILGVEVANLEEWATVAANSEEFAQAAVRDYWDLLMMRPPSADEAEEWSALWNDFRDTQGYSVEEMLRNFIRTEAYGAP